MKTTKLLTTILLILFAFSACKKSTDQLTSVIPAGVTNVIYIDTKSLIDKSNYDVFKNETVKKSLDEVKQLWGENKDAQKLLTEFIENDVNVLGVDLKGDMFVFTDENIAGLVLKVNDASRIKKVLVSAFNLPEEEIQVKDGINTLSVNTSICIAWDNNRMLTIAYKSRYSYKNTQDIEPADMAVNLMQQKSEESINSKAEFAQFMANKKDISVYTSFDNEITHEVLNMMGGSEILKYADQIKSFINIAFEKGEIIATSEIYFANDTVKTKFETMMAQVIKPINGNGFSLIPENPMTMLCFGLNGEGLNKFVQNSLVFRDREKNEMGAILPEFNGDILYYLDNMSTTKDGVDGYKYEGLKVRLGVLAETTQGKELVNKFMELGYYSDYKKVSETLYVAESYNKDSTFLGYKDNYFLFALNNNPFANVEGKNKMGNSAIGKLFYLEGNNKGLFNIINEKMVLNPTKSSLLENGVKLVESCKVSVDEQFKGQGRVELQNKDKNSMETICLYIDKLINSDLSYFF